MQKSGDSSHRRASSGRVVAQAKVNLCLRVGDAGSDGYHEVSTIFQRIDLGDDVEVHITRGSRALICEGADTGPPERNLAYRAAVLYAEQTGWPDGFDIRITKRVPVGGGLGGGSADAAATLRILNSLSPLRLSAAQLSALALQIGADVPFLAGESVLSIARGRGEKLRSCEPLPVASLTLFPMPFAVLTADAYRWVDESRPLGTGPPQALTSPRSWAEVAALAQNDFEPVVARRHPIVSELLAALRDVGFPIALMSGSGSTVFGVQYGDASGIAEMAREAGRRCGISAPPLHSHTSASVAAVEPM